MKWIGTLILIGLLTAGCSIHAVPTYELGWQAVNVPPPAAQPTPHPEPAP